MSWCCISLNSINMFRRYFFYLLLATGVCWLSWKLGDSKTQEPAVAVRPSGAVRYSSFNKEVNAFLSDTRRLYNARDFDALEKSAQAIRSQTLTFSEGSPKIVRFYAAFTCRNDEPESMWQLHEEIHRKWIAARPESITARIAYADFLVSYAGLASGFNLEKGMDRSMAEAFRMRLAAAKQTLEQARELSERDPVWWLVSLRVGQGQVWPAPVMRAFLEQGCWFWLKNIPTPCKRSARRLRWADLPRIARLLRNCSNGLVRGMWPRHGPARTLSWTLINGRTLRAKTPHFSTGGLAANVSSNLLVKNLEPRTRSSRKVG